ncbi:hypothetical protein H0H92_006195 [Tricholoma furcatifolium]|nr:hypothetical protein H0H92_006195 [Tricholoma furcatifolium]
MDMPRPPEHRECSKCKRTFRLDQFKATLSPGGDTSYSKLCIWCLKRRTEYSVEKKIQEDEDTAFSDDLTVVNEGDFLATVGDLCTGEDSVNLEARVKLVGLKDAVSEKDLRSAADRIAEEIWKSISYRFVYHSLYHQKRTPGIRFMYHCAQIDARQHKSEKTQKPNVKHRDKHSMETFDCAGWLHILVFMGSPVVHVKLMHKEDHIPYWCIDVPAEVKDFVNANHNLTSMQLWDEILKTNPTPKFSRKSIYHLWQHRASQEWKRDADEVKSTRILIDEATSPGTDFNSLYTVKYVQTHEEDGCTAVAFILKSLLTQWEANIREISIDSAWNTNGSNFEVYALLGEIYGSGCPLGYLLLHTSNGNSGAKERYLTEFLKAFQNACETDFKPIITLSDKDLSEINALRAVFTESKHQLCFWHCLRAIKQRLSILRRRPKYYHVLEAKHEFDWIDASFVPIAQSKDANPNTHAAEKAIPQLKLRIGGVLQNMAPEPHTAAPRLVVRFNGTIRSLVPLPTPRDPPDDNTNHVHNNSDIDDSEDPGFMDDVSDDDDDNDLRQEVRGYYRKNKDDNSQDAEDGPEWMFDAEETPSNDPKYVFCPAPHRKQLLHLFTKHFCQHPRFAERDGKWDTEKIRRNAVYEMYNFCYIRGLREVWGYMWASWYSPKMWCLWARSTSDYIPRLRTTMNVENFWRQLKHDYLHRVARPRLDHLVWILIYKVTPSYIARGEILVDTYRLGRSKQLTTYQKYFKSAWKKLEVAQVSGRIYTVDIKNWTCTCGRQKYDRHLLCKHLVQGVISPSSKFFIQVVRRRKPPFYKHPELIPAISATSAIDTSDVSDNGGVTDGDDHLWLGQKSILSGGGGWRDLIQNEERAFLGKRSNPNDNTQDPGPSTNKKRQHTDVEVIDLTYSSPPPETFDISLAESIPTPLRNSSPIAYGSDDEQQTDFLREELLNKARKFEEAARIFRSQAELQQNGMWMRHIHDHNVGNDVSALVDDITHYERSGRKRDTTWANGRGKAEKRRALNTMGYIRRA